MRVTDMDAGKVQLCELVVVLVCTKLILCICCHGSDGRIKAGDWLEGGGVGVQGVEIKDIPVVCSRRGGGDGVWVRSRQGHTFYFKVS